MMLWPGHGTLAPDAVPDGSGVPDAAELPPLTRMTAPEPAAATADVAAAAPDELPAGPELVRGGTGTLLTPFRRDLLT